MNYALHILLFCQHAKMSIKRHNMASALMVQALQKGPCGANQIAYNDIGGAENIAEQGLDLRNTANKNYPIGSYLVLTAHALKASSRPDTIFLPLYCMLFSSNHPQLRFSAAC